MNITRSLKILAFALLAAVVAAPAFAGGFYAFGSYWDVSDLGSAAGAGVKLSIPMGAVVNFDLRGTYYEQYESDDFFDRLIDDEDSPFRQNAVDVLPIDAGLSFNLSPRGNFTPTLGGGVSYFLLDTDRGSVDDEVGWYANGGLEFASQGSVGFFAEAIYRSATGTVESSPEDFRDVDDIEGIDFDDVDIDLDGFGANAGIVWRW
jgi:hypothetical protein